MKSHDKFLLIKTERKLDQSETAQIQTKQSVKKPIKRMYHDRQSPREDSTARRSANSPPPPISQKHHKQTDVGLISNPSTNCLTVNWNNV